MRHVQGQRGRSGLRRHLEGGNDWADVQDCYTRVENLRRELQVGLSYCDIDRRPNPILEQSLAKNLEHGGRAASSTLVLEKGYWSFLFI